MFEAGQQLSSWCGVCEKAVTATMAYGPVTIFGRKVEWVLRAVCDVCNNVVGLPPEATPAVAAALKRPGAGSSKTTVRIPSGLRDAVRAKLVEIGASPGDYGLVVNAFIVHYVDQTTHQRRLLSILSGLDAPVLHDPPDASISLRLKLKAWSVLGDVEDALNLHTSELIRRILAWFIGTRAATASARAARGEEPIVREARKLSMVS